MKMKEIHRSFTLSSQNGANFAGEKTKTRSLKEINSIYYITMSYLRFTKMFLLILACVMGGLSANAQTELASFSGKITGSEWTTDAPYVKSYYKMVVGTSITSPSIDVTDFNKYTFTINSASFGSITSKNESDILVSFKTADKTIELGTLSKIKGSTLTDRQLEIKANLTGKGQFIFTCPNATKGKDDACARINGITITGESASVTTLEAPKFDKAADATYYDPFDVEITTTEIGATIKYTTDGQDPSATVGTEYTAPVSITKTTTLKAVVVKGELVSPVTSATYTITQIENNGSFEKPYTPAEFIKVNPQENVWVKGVILGNATNSGEGFDANGTEKTNVCIGTTGKKNCMAIKIDDKNALQDLNLHNLLGKELMVHGKAVDYFGRKGIKTPQLFFIDGNDALAKMEVATKEGYSTFYNANSVQVPAGVQCGIVTGVENGVMTIDYKYQAGDKLPANTPVIVKAEGIQPYPLAITTSTAKVPAGNLLKGAAEDGEFTTEANYYYYKLAYDNFTAKTGLGFYWGEANGGAFTMKAGKAYLAVEKTLAQGAQKFSLEGNATGIEAVEQANEANRVVYTLDGRRVMNEKLAKGLYIINGKKVLVK